MKCSECGGTGKVHKYFYEKTDVGKWEKVCGEVACEECDGTGEIEVTNEEYLKSCNTEQLAKVLNKIFMTRTFCHICPEGGVCDISYKCKYHGGNTKDFVEWLKEKYREG